MKKLCLLFVLACLSTQIAYTQRITIKGIAADSTTKQPVEMATVALLKPIDSTLVQFTSTDMRGAFEFRKVEARVYLLKINFVGYNTFHKLLDLKADTDLDTLFLSNLILKEVTLKGQKDPVRIAQDTVEFNAGSFKTRTNATVEDLLKKLPGVQIDAKGNIKAQGQEITKVLVNGKEFFGGTPQTATQNLPADAISKVQVIDQKSDQAKLSGTDDGQNTKVINIETKDQNKRMNFGKAMAGYGTDDRYEGKGNFNTFNKTNQFSIIAMSNNVNNVGFSYEDFQDFSNRGGQERNGGGGFEPSFGGGDGSFYNSGFNFGWGNNFGFLRTNSIGVNMNQSLNKKVELNGSYFLNHSDNRVEKRDNSETFLNSNYFATNQSNNQNTVGLGHRGNFSLNYKIDTMRTLRLQANVDYNGNESNTLNQNNSLTNGSTPTNESQRENVNKSNRLNYRANLFYSQKFKKMGRTASINLAANNNTTRQVGRLQARNRFFVPDSVAILNQDNNQNNLTQTFNVRTTYSEPITKKLTFNLNHYYQINLNNSQRQVFDIENEQPKNNALLSNTFDNTFDYHNGGFAFTLTEKKYSFTVGLATQLSHLKGNTIGLPAIEKRFENILPNASFNYKFTKQTNLRVNYSTQINAPNVNQLQPVPNNTNPLNIILGNPDLKPAYNHRFSANFSHRNPDKIGSIFGYFSGGYTTNNIVQEQTVDSKLVRTSRPINTRGAFRASGNLSYSIDLKKLKSNVDFGVYSSYNQTINVINNVTSLIHQQDIAGEIGYGWEWEGVLQFSVDASLELEQTRYEANPTENQRFFNQNYEASLDIDGLDFLQLQANLDYQINRGITNDFYQAMPLLNVALSAPCLRNDRGEIKLSGVNLLNQNTGISQNVFANTIQQEFTNSLGRYLMLSFTYSFRDAKKPEMKK